MMKFEDFNKKQQEAIIEEGNVLVSAGAGSGKTAVLTQRVIYFNKNKNYKLNELLILTFTKLAAGEMKDRIRKALKEEGLEDANIVDTCDITTFDSYAFSLVKKYHYLLKLSKDIKIIDSSVISVMKRKIVNEIFEEYYKNRDKDFIKMIDCFCFKDDKDIVELALSLHSKACLDIDFNGYLDNFIDKYYYKNDVIYKEQIEAECAKIRVLADEINQYFVNDLLPDAIVSKNSNVAYNQMLNSLYINFINSNSYNEYISNFPDNYKINAPRNLQLEEKNVVKEFVKLCEKVKKHIDKLPKSEKEAFKQFKEYENIAKVLIKIVKELEQKVQQYKYKYQVYEFNDIAKKALALVKENNDVKETIKKQLKMIMIDEYQDTSIIQEEFISQIANNNVYMVGDIKQSIYRFRNARSDIFRDKYRLYKTSEEGKAIDLNTNYRSREEVLDDINYIFKNIMTLEFGGADYLNEHMIEFGNKLYTTVGDGGNNKHSEFILYENSDLVKQKGEAFVEANLIVKDIVSKINNEYQVLDNKNKKLRKCKFSDFCVLMDRDTDFEIYTKIFNEYHVPIFAESDENISNNESIKIFSNILKLVKCIKKGDAESTEFKHSFVSLVRSFIYGYDDEKIYQIAKNNTYSEDPVFIKLKNIVVNNSQLPIYNLFSKIIFEMNIYDSFINIGDVVKQERYLDTFLENFKQMSNIDYTIDDFLSYLEYVDSYKLKITLSTQGSSIDSVRIMNIHKSKGLEFPIIYFSGLHKNFNRMDLDKNYNVSDYVGLVLPPVDREQINLLKECHARCEIKEDISEKIRQFYVDLTRAKEKMIFVMSADVKKLKQEYIVDSLRPIFEIVENKKISEEEIIKLLFNEFITKNINCSALYYAINKLNLNLPKKFVHLLLDEKLKYTYEQLKEDYKEEKIITDKMKIIIENFENKETGLQKLINEQKISHLEYLVGLSLITPETKYELVNGSEYKKEDIEDVEQTEDKENNFIGKKNFKELILPFIHYDKLEKKYGDIEIYSDFPKQSSKMIEHKNLQTKELDIKAEKIIISKSSKSLKHTSSKKQMEFGTDIHLLMEVIDLKKPDYSFIKNEKQKAIVKQFIDSSLMENITHADIYKEYAFFNDQNNVNGVIDLMLVYKNGIDIIDYKTKNIDDEDYEKQLKIYKDYIENKFNKSVRIYLYSLLTGEAKEVK